MQKLLKAYAPKKPPSACCGGIGAKEQQLAAVVPPAGSMEDGRATADMSASEGGGQGEDNAGSNAGGSAKADGGRGSDVGGGGAAGRKVIRGDWLRGVRRLMPFTRCCGLPGHR